MANNPFLAEFIASCPGDLQRRLADGFDALLSRTDDEAAVQMKAAFDAILQERIDATHKD